MGDPESDKPELALGRKHPTWVFLRSSGTTLVIALGLLFGASAWLGLHEGIPSPFIGILRLLELSLTLCLSVAAGLIALAIYYRRRVRGYQARSRVRDLYVNRTWLQSRYLDFLVKAEEEFIVAGISLHTFTTQAKLREALQAALGSHQNLHVHLVYMNPASPTVRQRELEEGRERGRIVSDCRRNIAQAEAIMKELGQLGKRLHIHIVSGYAPIGFFLVCDQDLFFEPYLQGRIGRTCPVLRMQKNEENARVWHGLRDHLTSLIESARTGRPAHGVLRVRTTFGYLPERSGLKKAVFLDRDGVIIEDKGYPSDPKEVVLLPGAAQALQALAKEYRLVVVTNQSGVARGYFTLDQLEAVNERLLSVLDDHGASLDAIYSCPHHRDGAVREYAAVCPCRKPEPGLLLEAIEEFQIDPAQSYMVGDKLSDVEAGASAGVRTILVTGHSVPSSSREPTAITEGLAEAAEMIINGAV